MEFIDLYVLRLLLNPVHHRCYHSTVDLDFIRSNNKLLGSVFSSLGPYFEKYPDKPLEPTNLQVWYLSLYPALPKAERDLLSILCSNLEKLNAFDPNLAEDYLKTHQERSRATQIGLKALRVSEGKETFQSLVDELKTVTTVSEAVVDEFVTDDLEALLDQTIRTSGLNWRLGTLQQMLGPLRLGDFGFIFKRPETGGTTLLASEVTYMATQTDRPILWVNNEERGAKVKIRCYEAFFGKSIKDLNQGWEKYKKEYLEKMGGRILLYDKAFTHKRAVERMCEQKNPALIIFDQIDKVKGFDGDRYDLEMKVIYQWARELAKSYGPVIGICQAAGSAEGKQWLTMDDVDSSKTAKQGEADWILGIGKQHKEGMENVRYFNVVKNKNIIEEESMRHGKAPVIILPQIARYADYQ